MSGSQDFSPITGLTAEVAEAQDVTESMHVYSRWLLGVPRALRNADPEIQGALCAFYAECDEVDSCGEACLFRFFSVSPETRPFPSAGAGETDTLQWES